MAQTQKAPGLRNSPTELGRQIHQMHKQIVALQADAEAKEATIRALQSQAPPTPTPTRNRTFTVTQQHESIFKAMCDGSCGLGIMAVAGSGKTSTLVAGADAMLDALSPATFSFVAFGKANAETLRRRLPVQVSSSTIHSLCWRSICRARGWSTQDGDGRIKRSRLRQAASATARRHASGDALARLERELEMLWGLAVNTQTPLEGIEAIGEMAQQYGADVDPDSRAPSLLLEVDAMLRSQPETISMDEMLRIVVEEELPIEQSDYVMIDEVQDLNRLQIEVVARLRPKKVIAVGDPRQAIYAFRGSDHRAVDVLCNRFNITQRLPLSTTYRCAKSITAEARRIVREIRPLPDAPDGDVIELPADRLTETLAAAKPGDLIVCRSNAPLIASALYAQHKGLWAKVCFFGGDSGTIENGLDMAQRLHGTTDPAALARAILADSEEKAKKMESHGAAAVADASRDRNLVLALLLKTCGSIAAAQAWVKDRTSTSLRADSINCATIHRAKGAEAERVIFLGHNLVPNRQVLAGANAALITQEWNLYYVAVTRAARLLIKQALDRDNLAEHLMSLFEKT